MSIEKTTTTDKRTSIIGRLENAKGDLQKCRLDDSGSFSFYYLPLEQHNRNTQSIADSIDFIKELNATIDDQAGQLVGKNEVIEHLNLKIEAMEKRLDARRDTLAGHVAQGMLAAGKTPAFVAKRVKEATAAIIAAIEKKK